MSDTITTCSQAAWTFATEASYQCTWFKDASGWQDEILSITEEGDTVTVKLRREDGTEYTQVGDLRLYR
jgi:hypothetical protein